MSKQQNVAFSKDSASIFHYYGSDLASFGGVYTYFGGTSFTKNLNQGFYLIDFYKGSTGTFQSDNYPCPFNHQFTDITGIFQACTGTLSPPPPAPFMTNLHQQKVIKAHRCGTR